MAASLRVLQQQTRCLSVRLFDVRLSCLHSSWVHSTGSSVLISNRRCKSSKVSKVPEDHIRAPYKVTRMLFNNVVNFLTNSVDKLETRMPKTYQVYTTFRTGVSLFISDTKQYYRITSNLWNGESMSRFTRRELELYRQFSSDLPVMAMVLIIAFAPGGAFIFPVAYMFPRYLLSPHFWTKEQKEEFRHKEMAKKLGFYTPVLDTMYKTAQGTRNEKLVQKVISKLITSVPLSYQEISSLKPMFQHKPFSLDTMSYQHRRVLSKSLGMSFMRYRLEKDALIIRYIDVALRREGLDNLTNEDLARACSWRGVNPEDMTREAQLTYLDKWTQVTADVHESSISLLLHLPVLLGYCQPSNRKVIGPKRTVASPRR